MLSHSHTLRIRASLAMAALLAVGMSLSPSVSSAADGPTLVDEGISQIVSDAVVERLEQYLDAYSIKSVRSVAVEGEFRSMTKESLSQQLTESLKRREILVDEKSTNTLGGRMLLSETEESVLVMMECTLTDNNDGNLCTVRVRKVLASVEKSE